MNIPPAIEESNRLTVHRLTRIAVALALIGLIFSYPGAISSPYSDTGLDGYYDNQIVERANDIESIEHSAVTDETTVYQYDKLSPVAKEVFDKTRSAADDSFTIVLCHEWTLTCDEYYESDVPDEFQYGAVGHNVDEHELYTVVEDEGEAYVLQTGALGHADGWDLSDLPLVISSSLMVLLVSGVLVHNTIKPPEQSGNGFAAWDIGAAFLIGTFALAVPYLHMWDILSVSWSRRLITGAVALGVPAYYLGLR
ncbi:hypothetical protein [Halorubrum laminariae]|uniref:Uncharacterized protein n=1 Tax=Halorubrum laminariae TaxID=1433523 RepID=A0ABD6C4I1_9EURY|nr:hypothetical protein [Halorubrum laminariae]